MSSEIAPTIVIGIGNSLLSDEGIGVHLLHALAKEAAQFPEVEFYDLGSGGMGLLHLLAGRRKAILLDCAFMNETAGTIRRFLPEAVRTGKQLSGFSLHEGDLLQVLELAHTLGQAADEVIIFGIQPASIEPGAQLSAELAKRLGEYLDLVRKDLLG